MAAIPGTMIHVMTPQSHASSVIMVQLGIGTANVACRGKWRAGHVPAFDPYLNRIGFLYGDHLFVDCLSPDYVWLSVMDCRSTQGGTDVAGESAAPRPPCLPA